VARRDRRAHESLRCRHGAKLRRHERDQRQEPAVGSLRARIESGEVVRGLLLDTPDPALIELSGHAGLDLVCLDFEHGAFTDVAADGAIRAAETARLPLLARVRLEEAPRAVRFLDSGGAGVIIAHVSTVGDVEAAMDALLIPPLGRRGVGATRISRLGFDATDKDWATRQNAQLVFGMQIEGAEGVENAAEIAGHPYVSLILVGNRDLSFDLGVPGRYTDPKVEAAMKTIRAACDGRAALAMMVRDLASSEPVNAQVLLLGLGAMMRFAVARLGQIT
jgi:4-hydroxy-2-oxoheptanedioate aldolase